MAKVRKAQGLADDEDRRINVRALYERHEVKRSRMGQNDRIGEMVRAVVTERRFNSRKNVKAVEPVELPPDIETPASEEGQDEGEPSDEDETEQE